MVNQLLHDASWLPGTG